MRDPCQERGFFRSDSFRCLRRPDFFLCDKKKPGKEKALKGTYSEAVPLRNPPRRPREKPRGGFPHWILLPWDGDEGRETGCKKEQPDAGKSSTLASQGKIPAPVRRRAP